MAAALNFDGLLPKLMEQMRERGVRIIGISGKKGHGKDTVADAMVKMHRTGIIISFASSLKNAVASIFAIDSDHMSDAKAKETVNETLGVTPRRLLQYFGTDVMRNAFGDNIWIISLCLAALDIDLRWRDTWRDGDAVTIIIPDVRFPNEAEFVRSYGGTLIRVDASTRVPSTDTHISETALDDYAFPVVIDNNGSRDELFTRLREAGFLVD